MELRVLRYFLALAQEESISAAAEYLHVTQPTLSRQLMDLEDSLGKPLFIRGKRTITLTEDGLILRKRASEIMELVEQTESAFRESNAGVHGDIYIGSAETEAMRMIAQTAKQLQATHPGIRYHLFSGNADDVTERLDKGLLDFGLLIEPFDMKKYDFIKLPVKDVWGVLLRHDHPLAKKTAIRPEDLWDLPLLTSRQSLVSNELSGWMGRDFARLTIVSTYNLVYNASLMVDEGLGLALCLDKLVNTSTGSTLRFRPLAPRLEVGLDIVWKKHAIFSTAAGKFVEHLLSQLHADTSG